jgi:hypothetical protein
LHKAYFTEIFRTVNKSRNLNMAKSGGGKMAGGGKVPGTVKGAKSGGQKPMAKGVKRAIQGVSSSTAGKKW